MPLTDDSVRAAKPKKAKTTRLRDSRGLSLALDPAGSKSWSVAYSFGGSKGELPLGEYPAVSLEMARERRDAVLRMVERGVDPAGQPPRWDSGPAGEQESLFRAIFDNSPYSIVIQSITDGRYLAANPRFLDQIGISEEELASFPALLYFGEEPDEVPGRLASTAAEGGVRGVERSLTLPDGRTRHCLYSSIPIVHESQPRLLTFATDITARKNAELALQASEAKYKAIFNNSPIGVFQADESGDHAECNPALARMLGYPAPLAQRQRRDLFDRLFPDEAERKEALGLLQGSPGGIVGREIELVSKKGRRQLILNASLHRANPDEPGQLVGVVEDITERKAAQEAAQVSEGLLSALKANIPDLIWIKDPQGVFLGCNPAFEKYFDTPEREIIGKTDFDFVDEATARQYRANDLRTLESGLPTMNEERIRDVRGDRVRVFETIKTPMRDARGNILGVLGIARDITARQERETELQRWIRKFDIVNAASGHIFYDYDLISETLQWKGATREVLGLEPEELNGHVERWASLLHPDERDGLLEQLAAARATCGKFEVDYRIRHKDGHYAHVHESGLFITAGGEEAVQMLGVVQDVSARHNSEMALIASEKRYRTLFQSAKDTIMVLDGNRIVDCNPAGELLLDRPASSIIGRTPAELSPEFQQGGIASEILQDIHLRDSGGIFGWTHKKRSGEEVYVEVSLTPMEMGEKQYRLALLRDVTERKHAEEMIRQSEEKFAKAFSMAPYCITLTRLRDSVVIDVNEAFTSLTGYPTSAILGRRVLDLNLWADPGARTALVQAIAREGIVPDHEFLMRRKDGAIRSVVLTAQQITIAGEPCYIALLRDITEHKQVQQVMVQNEKMMSLGGLAAGMAHEINNPLGIILQSAMGVQRRLDPALPANQREAQALELDLETVHRYMEQRNITRYLEGILEAAGRAAEIVRSMLNFSRRTDSGMAEQDLPTLIRLAVSLAEKDYDLKKKYDFRQIALTLDLAPDLPLCVCIPSEMEQVLLNLLRNAAQALAEAKTPASAITIRARKEHGFAVIEVADNGPGIAPEHLGHVFEPFYTTKKVGEGTGLGLSVSYFIVTTTHRGKLTVDSTPGAGTTFTVRLPLNLRVKPGE